MPVRAPHEPPSSRSRIAPPPELVALTARSPPVPIPPSGNAPASKLLTYGTAAASLLTHYSRAHHRVGLTPRGLFARGELLSRWLTSQFAFTAPGEACFGLYLLHALRDVERGEELTYDYKFELEDDDKVPCNCGAAKCRVWMN